MSGVNVSRVKIIIYMLSGFLAGCAGVMAAAKYGAAHWAHGNLAELKAIAAVAIGGANINGGSGTIGGTVLGVIFLAVVHNAFVTSAVNTFWYDVVSGMMLLIAVLLSRFIALRNARALLGLKQSKMDQLSATKQNLGSGKNEDVSTHICRSCDDGRACGGWGQRHRRRRTRRSTTAWSCF